MVVLLTRVFFCLFVCFFYFCCFVLFCFCFCFLFFVFCCFFFFFFFFGGGGFYLSSITTGFFLFLIWEFFPFRIVCLFGFLSLVLCVYVVGVSLVVLFHCFVDIIHFGFFFFLFCAYVRAPFYFIWTENTLILLLSIAKATSV